MNKTFTGLIKLTRLNEYVYFLTVTTLLWVSASKGAFDRRMIILLAANWLAVGFAFMINDTEDAPDDALSSNKITRYPVSAGLITAETTRKTTFFIGFLSAVLFALLGVLPFVLGERATYILMILMLTINFISGIISFFKINIIPGWALVITALFSALFILPPLFKRRRNESRIAIQGSSQKPFKRAVSPVLLLQFLLPWLDNLLNFQLF